MNRLLRLTPIFFTLLLYQSLEGAEFNRLPSLNIDPNRVTISGISSGAAMAAQVFVAHSDAFSGLAMVAGPIYGCSGGSPLGALECMKYPYPEMLYKGVERVNELSRNNQIDHPWNLKKSKVFILHGDLDSLVAKENAYSNQDLFSTLISDTAVKLHIQAGMEHSFPTTKPEASNSCSTRASPYVSRCPIDGAQLIFEHLDSSSPLDVPKPSTASLYTFVQSSYDPEDRALLNDRGHLYIPQACKGGALCGLHVALHGCEQSPEQLEDQFLLLTSYIDEADARNLVVLFPSTKKSMFNPKGCWDWWGYTGRDYLSRDAPQIKAIKAMMDALTYDLRLEDQLQSTH